MKCSCIFVDYLLWLDLGSIEMWSAIYNTLKPWWSISSKNALLKVKVGFHFTSNSPLIFLLDLLIPFFEGIYFFSVDYMYMYFVELTRNSQSTEHSLPELLFLLVTFPSRKKPCITRKFWNIVYLILDFHWCRRVNYPWWIGWRSHGWRKVQNTRS